MDSPRSKSRVISRRRSIAAADKSVNLNRRLTNNQGLIANRMTKKGIFTELPNSDLKVPTPENILKGARVPAKLVDPYGTLGTKHNFKREYWASKGQAFTTLQLRNALQMSYSIVDKMISAQSRQFNFEAIYLCDQMNAIFLTCPSVEDHRILAGGIFQYNQNVVPYLIDVVTMGEALVHVVLQTLYNLSYHLESRAEMADNGIFETILGLFPLAPVETTTIGLEIIESLTDFFTSPLRIHLTTRSNIKNLLSTVRTVENERIGSDLDVYLPTLLTVFGRVVFHTRARSTIYRNGDTLLRTLQVIQSHLDGSNNNVRLIKKLRSIQEEIHSIVKMHGTNTK